MPRKKPPTQTTAVVEPSGDGQTLFKEFSEAQTSMVQFRTRWEEFLDIAYARLTNQAGFKSRVREGTLSNLLWERAARVVAQMPSGKIQYLGRDDIGKSLLMDIVWHKYVIPGANTDYSFFTKMRMWDYYSMVYGAAPAFYDYRVDDEYTGPDWTVLDPRYVFPQAGRLSFQRCQFQFIEAYHNKEYLEAKKKLSGWNTKNIEWILANYKEGAQPDNSKRTTNLQSDRGQSIDLHKGEIQLVTKYERGKKGRWITFAPQYENRIVRDIPNPHKSGRLPIVFKFCFPLLDSIWGMGDVERGESLQKAIDTYVNLAMDFSKFKLYPTMWYADGVNASNLRYEPGAKWKLPKGQESAGFFDVGQSSNQEMTSGYQFLSGALQRQNGTTQTNISSGDSDPSQGKTPQAIDNNEAKENSRDNWDRNMLEEAYSELTNGMINLIGEKQPASIEFHIFDDDIKKIYDAGYKDVLEIYNSAWKPKIETSDDGIPSLNMQGELNGKGAAKATIGPDDVKGAYRFYIDPGTTMATDDQEEYTRLQQIGEMIATPEGQQMVAGLSQEQRQFSYGAYFKKLLIASGTQDWEEIIPEINNQSQGTAGQAGGNGAQMFNPASLQDPQAQAMYQQSQGQPTQDPQAQAQAQQQQDQDMQKTIEDKATEMAKQMIAKMPQKGPAEMIAYKDASPLTKAHMEAAAGWTPDPVHQLEEAAAMAQHGQTITDSTVSTMHKPLEPNPQEQMMQDQANQQPQPTGVQQ